MMKYSRLHSVPTSGSFIVEENFILISSKNSILKLNESFIFDWEIEHSDSFGLIDAKGLFVSFTNKSVNSFIDYSGNRIKELEKFNIYNIDSLIDYCGFDRNINKTVFVKDGKIIAEYDFKFVKKLSLDSIMFTTKSRMNNAILCLNEGVTKWELDFQDQMSKELKDSKVNDFLGVYDEKLLLACSNSQIISLDINKGKFIERWYELPGINKGAQNEGVIPKPESFVLDTKNGKLIGAFHKYYIEIDLNTSDISYTDIEEELGDNNIYFIKQVSENAFTEDHLFLTAMMNKKEDDNKWSYDCLFTLNRRTLKIDWKYDFEDQSLGTHTPKLSNNRLYQLDNDGTLHIFKKDEQNIS